MSEVWYSYAKKRERDADRRTTMTHRMLAQHVTIVARRDDVSGLVLVEYEDGSRGWHDGPLVPISFVERFAE